MFKVIVSLTSQIVVKPDLFHSKTRSPGQIFEKHCRHIKDHIFIPVNVKIGQCVCLDDISAGFKSHTDSDLTLYQTTNFRLFQTERVCRR